MNTSSELWATSRCSEGSSCDRPRGSTAEEGDTFWEARAFRQPWDLDRPSAYDVVWRIVHALENDRAFVHAAGIAFYLLLAFPPLVSLLVFAFGIIVTPDVTQSMVLSLSPLVPPEARSLFREIVVDTVGLASSIKGPGIVTTLLAGAWAASNAASMLIKAINDVYDEAETRSLFELRVLALKVVGAALAFGGVLLMLVVAGPLLLSIVGLGTGAKTIFDVLRWPLLALSAVAGLALLYRHAPNRRRARWPWVMVGAGAATGGWLLVTWGFSAYVVYAAGYNRMYGSLAGLAIFLIWLYLTAVCVLAGAELNAELEHQTALDSTVGAARPRGQRGAAMADHVGLSRPWADPTTSSAMTTSLFSNQDRSLFKRFGDWLNRWQSPPTARFERVPAKPCASEENGWNDSEAPPSTLPHAPAKDSGMLLELSNQCRPTSSGGHSRSSGDGREGVAPKSEDSSPNYCSSSKLNITTPKL